MKILIILLVIFFCINSFADDSFLGNEPGSGFIISVSTRNGISFKSNESVLIQGKIKFIDSDYNSEKNPKDKNQKNKKSFLESLRKQGIDILAHFPSDSVEVTSNLILKDSSANEVEFSYTTSALKANDLNQFSIQIYNNHKDKEKIKRLSGIKAKLERRLLALSYLRQQYHDKKKSEKSIALIQKEIDILSSVILKISARLNSSSQLIAQYKLPLQVDNLRPNYGYSSTIMNKYLLSLEVTPGSLIQGMNSKIKGIITNLRHDNDHNEDNEDLELKLAELKLNNKIVSNLNPQKLNGGKSLTFEFETEILSPAALNDIQWSFYKYKKPKSNLSKNSSDKNKDDKSNNNNHHEEDQDDNKNKLIGYVNYKIPVAKDLIVPEWLTLLSTPSSNTPYVQNMPAILLKVSDSFGRINPSTLLVQLYGTIDSDQSLFNQNLSGSVTKTKFGDGESYEFSAAGVSLSEGLYTLKAQVKDFGGNFAVQDPFSVQFRIDRTAPQMAIGIADSYKTNQKNIDIPVFINDLSPTHTEVFINNERLFATGSKQFTASGMLNIEGNNIIRITCIDDAGNKSLDQQITVLLDTIPPVITFITPINRGVVNGISFPVQVKSNEPLLVVNVNALSMKISEDKLQASVDYTTIQEGPLSLTVTATDMLGNSSQTTIEVISQQKVLNISLVGVYADEKNGKLLVKGAVGSTRPGSQVSVTGWFFEKETVVSDNRGSFMVSMSPFTSAKVRAFDPIKNEALEGIVNFGENSDTFLSGIVRDINNQPLSGVTVKIIGSTLVTVTDGNGIFKFSKAQLQDKMVTGDQQLLIDGTTVPHVVDGPLRKFSTTTVAISIGIKQSNILQTPIYLAPILLDNSGTTITAQSGGVVTDTNAPGVELNIPASATVFPQGQTTENISMLSIPSEYSTIPPLEVAKPKTVIALEPSGTTFKTPIELKLPNYNKFPAKTEMVIMLMNSRTGKWEVGGAAAVSDSGQEVITKPGQGISHFSLAYATILGPTIRQIGAQDKPGADTMNGAVSSQVKLPSFKVLGKDISPSLVYKSTWAKPQAVVTNLFDFPDKKIDLTIQKQFNTVEYQYKIDMENCWRFVFMLFPSCTSDIREFYRTVPAEITFSNVTSEIQPKYINANLYTNSLKSETYKFSQIPRMASVSFALELKDPTTNKYFDSGIYPYHADYEIIFDELIMGTKTDSYWNSTMDAKVESVEDFTNTTKDQVFNQSYSDSLIVQNYRESSAGNGWKVGGYQKILNPNANKIIIEEADGATSSYSLGNTIQTVMDVGILGGDLSRGVGLNRWPAAVFTASNSESIIKGTFNGSTSSGAVIGSHYSMAPIVAGYDYFNWEDTPYCWQEKVCYDRRSGFGGNICVREGYETRCNPPPQKSSCSADRYQYNIQSRASQMLDLNGRVIGTDFQRHAIFDLSGAGSTRIFGSAQPPNTFGNYYGDRSFSHNSNIANYISTIPGISLTSHVENFYFVRDYYNGCPDHLQSSGEVPAQNDQVVNGAQAINQPMGITTSPWLDIIVFADYGNHRVRSIKLGTREHDIIAGNGQVADTGDGGPARDAALFHPRGVIYDAQGNLYISTESGYIRRVDTNGNIMTIAGDPVNGKYSNESLAHEVLFNKPYGLAIDNEKKLLYVADTGHNRVVQIDLINGYANTVAGTGAVGFSGDGKSALDASLNSPTLVHVDSDGNLIIADTGNNRIRRVTFQNVSSGILSFNPSPDDGSNLKRLPDGTWERTYRNQIKAYFTTSGYEYAERDRLGQLVNFTYDTQNRLTEVKFPTGQSLIYSYSGKLLSSITDPAGRNTVFNYDSSGNLTKVYYPDNTHQSFEYDQEFRLTSEINQRNAPTKYQYNPQGRLEKVITPDNKSIVVNDLASRNLKNYDPNATVNSPNSIGVGSGQVNDSITDAKGNTTVIAKDFEGYISTIVDAKGKVTQIKRDLKGRPIEILSPDGSHQKFTYNDATSDVLSTESVELGIKESKTYNVYGQVLTETNGRNQTTINTYDDSTGLLIKSTYPLGYSTFNYYPNGLLKQKIINNGSSSITTNYSYSPQGLLIEVTDNGGKKFNFEYDLAGNRTKSISTTNGSDTVVTQYEFDNFNRLTKVTSPKNEITSYEYLDTGELAKITDPQNNETLFEYNIMGRLTKKTDTLGMFHQFEYDDNGNRNKEIDPNGNVKIFAYNELNQLTKVQLPDDLIQYEYTDKGDIRLVSNNVSSVENIYDFKSRVIGVNTTGLGTMSSYPNVNLTYQYDEADNRIATNSSYGNLNYSFDANNRMTGISNSWGDNFTYNYDAASRLVSLIRPNGYSNYSYTSSGTLEKIDHIIGGSLKESLQYSYDQRNYPTQKRTIAGNFNYSYDGNGQLLSASNPSSATENFTYDAIGNRIADNQGNFVYDAKLQRLTSDYQFNYLFDNNGNLTLKQSKDSLKESYKFSYSSSNQLIKIEVLTGSLGASQVTKEISFKYDVLGRRMQKSVKDFVSSDLNKTYTRSYSYDGENILFEFDGSNTLLARHTHNPLTLDDVLSTQYSSTAVNAGVVQASGNYYYHKDHLGSVIAISDSSGNIKQKYNYSSFGKILSISDGSSTDISNTPAIKSSFTYTGREYEEEASLYYYRARFYDPSTGRFLQQDPEPGKLNLPISILNKFIYATNNPLLFKDPTGRESLLHDIGIGLVIIGAFVTGAWVAGVAAGALGFVAGSWGAAIVGTLVGAAVGGAAGALAFPALGLGNSSQGFIVGAMAGSIGGLARGLGWLSKFSTSSYKSGHLADGVESGTNSLIKRSTAEGSMDPAFRLPRGTEFTELLGTIEPYVIGIGGGLFLDYTAYQCAQGKCNIPNIPISIKF